MNQALEPTREEPREGALQARLEELEGEVEALTKQLARHAAERDELLTIVSHELRTPVTVIAGFGRLLLSERVGPLNAEQRRFLEESARSCRRLDAFIANLIEGGRAEQVAPREGSLGETLEGVAAFMEPLLEERRLRIEVDLPPEADRAWFDPDRIVQVLTNGIGNAIKYSPEGGTIAVAARRTEHAGRPFVEVSVADAGPGIPEADRERVFEPWVQGERGRGARGLGLGLAICRRIVEAHGGTIRAEAAPQGGCRLAFCVPAEAPRERSGGERVR